MANESKLNLQTATGTIGGRVWHGAGRDQAPALIFYNANGFCISTYRQILSVVAEKTGTNVVGLDLRGHGLTRLPADPDRMDTWDIHARDISAALRELAPHGAVLGGHSMGATSCLLAAAATPALVKGLVLFDPVLAPSGFYLYARLPWSFASWRKHFPLAKAAGRRRAEFDSRNQAIQAYRGRGAFKTWQPGYLEDYCEDGFIDMPDGKVSLACAPAFEAACYAGQRHDPHKAMRQLHCSGVILRGAKFSTATEIVMKRARKAGLDVQTIENTGHFLPMERPDLAINALVDAIQAN